MILCFVVPASVYISRPSQPRSTFRPCPVSVYPQPCLSSLPYLLPLFASSAPLSSLLYLPFLTSLTPILGFPTSPVWPPYLPCLASLPSMSGFPYLPRFPHLITSLATPTPTNGHYPSLGLPSLPPVPFQPFFTPPSPVLPKLKNTSSSGPPSSQH